jgi:phosphatidylserine decarboxylase
MIVIFVGALNVGSISTPWTGEINPRNNGKIVELNLNQTVPFTLKKGDLLGWFNMGSTVITLFSKDSCQWDQRLKLGRDIKMGDIIGSLSI